MQILQIDIKGRVQGVSFRKSVKKIADNLNVYGYVKNNEDGSVSILAKAPKEKLEVFQYKIKSNPGFSKIDVLNIHDKNSVNFNENKFLIIKNGSLLTDKPKSWIHLGKYYLIPKKSITRIPLHIAIIPDGNRRWAIKKGKYITFGHEKSAAYENLKSLFDEAKSQGVKYMTIWGFSTENWKRSQEEIKVVFNLITNFLKDFQQDLHNNKTRFIHLGRKDRLPKDLVDIITKLENETSKYDDFCIQLCLDYGGRDEIIRAVNKAISTNNKQISEDDFKNYLDTKSTPDVDLIIRTSGEKRLSGFLPFQSTYAEFFFTDKHFPDFDRNELKKAIEDFSNRKRRYGGN